MLMKDAKTKGICLNGYSEMKDCPDIDSLIDFYIRGIDWCLENNFPTLQYLRANFSNIQDKGIFVDQKFRGKTFSNLQTYIFHNCSGTIKVAMDYKHAVIPMLYFANNCHITVTCEQPKINNVPPIRVPLYIFGDNVITVNENENAVFTKYQIDLL